MKVETRPLSERTCYPSLDFAPPPPPSTPSCNCSWVCLHRHASTFHQKRLSILSSFPVSAMAPSGDSSQRSAPVPGLPQPSFNTLQFGTMSDSQLRQTISQLSHAASGSQYQSYAAPTPQRTAGKRPPPLRKSSGFIVYHRSRNSLPKKHRQLVNIFDSTTPHCLAAQPSREK